MKLCVSSSRSWKYALVSINIFLGLFLWLDYFTNISVSGKYTEFWYPPIIGLIGLTSCIFLIRNNLNNSSKLYYKIACLPSIIGGFISLILLIPPMCLFSLFLQNNSTTETRIEQEISPNRLQMANVYHSFIGTVNADDKISIRISYRWLPVIEKEVYFTLDQLWCSNNPNNCIEWIDDDKILLLNSMEKIKTQGVDLSLPLWFLELQLTRSLLRLLLLNK
jgi:hypothetical protein